jgi:hypothetical protein
MHATFQGHKPKVLQNWIGQWLRLVPLSDGRAVLGCFVIRKLQSGKYRLYSRKKNPKTGKRRNLGTFNSRNAAEKHERAVQFFKRH